MVRQIWRLFLLLAVFAATFSVCAYAEDGDLLAIQKAPETVRRGASFSVILSLSRSDIAAFVVQTTFEPDAVEQAKAVFSDSMKAGHTVSGSMEGSRLAASYVAKPGAAAAGPLTLTFFTSAASLSDSVDITITLQEAADTSGNLLSGTPQTLTLSIPFTEPTSSDSTLLSLEPPAGTLQPAFDPEIFEYALDVPYESQSLVFDAKAAPNASVRANRRNLGAGGSTVDFLLTVTAADGVTKSVYKIAVTRLEKEEAAPPPDSSATSKAPTAKAPVTKATTAPKTTTAPKGSATPQPSPPAGSTDNASVSSGGTVVTNTAPAASSRADRIETAVIVLLSVCVGAILTAVLLTIRGKYTPRHGKEKH